ncbi:hypothetical protein A9Q81_20800 [Gammaproteobacteria bacterium 42_54_T18]|nr:hypothetical protein A9Q81_20800 [Gammaproteobacteria bacterium 42_54_T18]
MIRAFNSPKARKRYVEGRQARLRAEVFNQLQDLAVNYSCVYLRPEHASQHRRGWDSVTVIDIDVAVKKVKAGQAKLLPETARQLHPQQKQGN